ncbi:MAG TPA: TonB-dependent receptor [Sphingomicrobium sp.]|nr:TonB-dependent receptor [Sphingomicrobium sp.]
MAAAQAAGTQSFNIPSQDLGKALTDLARQSNREIYFPSNLTRGKRAPALSGDMTADQALTRLLAGSGLSYRINSSGAITILSTVGNALAGAETAQSSGEVAPRGVISGQVVDERTGAALKGALIELVDSGRQTSTNDLGEFRFVGLPDGTYNVRISYLGYGPAAGSISIGAGRGARQRFELVGGTAKQEIVVYGQRSARAQALNQERTAENVTTVVSADLLGDFGGQTLSESLRRAPGVSFQRDAFTGDGTNIMIRGLDPDLNAIKLNGIELPEGSGTGRSASLSNILTESIDKVTISKTLLASQDSSGTGGLVEIETKSPLDRERRYASFSVEGAKRENDFNKEFSVSGTLSARFGKDDNFGLSASVQYRDRTVQRLGYDTSLVFGEYLPLQVDGAPTISHIDHIDPRRAFPFEPGATGAYPTSASFNFDSTDGTTLTTTLSAAIKLGNHTEIRTDWLRTDQKDTRRARSSSFQTNMNHRLFIPVQELAGEVRAALTWPNNFTLFNTDYQLHPERRSVTNVFSLAGTTNLNRMQFRYRAGYTSGYTSNLSYFLGSRLRLFRQVDPSFVTDDAGSFEGRILSLFPERTGSGVPVPALTEEGFAFFNDPALYQFGFLQKTDGRGKNNRLVFELDGKYEFTSDVLKYVEAGIDLEDSRFKSYFASYIRYDSADPRPTFEDLGVTLDEPGLGPIGIDDGFRLVSFDDLGGLIFETIPARAVSCAERFTAGAIWRCERDLGQFNGRAKTGETELAGYVQGRVDVGRLEMIGGLRISRYETAATQPRGPRILDENYVEDLEFHVANQELVSEKATQTTILPRMLANYRLDDNLVFRAGYFQSIARPQINLLSQSTLILLLQDPFRGPNANQRELIVEKGNPDLKSARTDSLDFSAEYYDRKIGVLKLGAFYKRIKNLLESNISQGVGGLADVDLPDDPRFQDVLDNPEDYSILITIPENNKSAAHIWGIEAALEKQLTFLPGALSGLGIIANYTYTKSSKKQPFNWSRSPVLGPGGTVTGFQQERVIFSDLPFNNQPKHSGTIGVTYNKYGIDANIAYTMQGRRQLSFAPRGLSTYEEAFGTLDMRTEYRFGKGGKYRIFAEGTDLLRDYKDASLERTVGADNGHTGKWFTGGQYFGGRQIRAGVTATF